MARRGGDLQVAPDDRVHRLGQLGRRVVLGDLRGGAVATDADIIVISIIINIALIHCSHYPETVSGTNQSSSI